MTVRQSRWRTVAIAAAAQTQYAVTAVWVKTTESEKAGPGQAMSPGGALNAIRSTEAFFHGPLVLGSLLRGCCAAAGGRRTLDQHRN